MISTAFEHRPLVAQSFMQRLLKQNPLENAILELNNLLASTPIQSITAQSIQVIERKYGLSLRREFRLNLEEFYAVQLNYALTDKRLSAEELADLTHLRTILQLPPAVVSMLHARIGEAVYRHVFEEAIQDGHLSIDERSFLSELQQSIALPPELANQIANEVGGNYLARFVEEYGADARISPEEDAQLQLISKNIGFMPDKATKRTLDRFKLYWTLENADLPVVEIAMPLQKLEQCHFHLGDVQWYEERATARRGSYTEHYLYNKSFDIIQLESGHSTVQKETFDLLKQIDVGDLYVTNRRIIFVGASKTTSFKLSALAGVTAFKQGLSLVKLTGKNPLMMTKRDADVFALICRRVLRDI